VNPLFLVLIVVYAIAAVGLVVGARPEDAPLYPARIFLAVTMLGWAVLYVFVAFGLGSSTFRHHFGRWLHLPTAIAVIHVAWARRELYRARNGSPGTDIGAEA
jgi:hypothetical protein